MEGGIKKASSTINELRAISGIDGDKKEDCELLSILCQSLEQVRAHYKGNLSNRLGIDKQKSASLVVSTNHQILKHILSSFLSAILESTKQAFTLDAELLGDEIIFYLRGQAYLSKGFLKSLEVQLNNSIKSRNLEIKLGRSKLALWMTYRSLPQRLDKVS